MERPTIIEIARKARGWTQRELALAGGTSQPTLSAYERREKSPSLAVTERLIGEAGYSLKLDVTVDFSQVTFNGHDIHWIPDRLWRVEPRLCFSKVKFPDAVAHRESGEWQQRYFDLANRNDRRRVYQYLLQAGIPVWIWRWVDGASSSTSGTSSTSPANCAPSGSHSSTTLAKARRKTRSMSASTTPTSRLPKNARSASPHAVPQRRRNSSSDAASAGSATLSDVPTNVCHNERSRRWIARFT